MRSYTTFVRRLLIAFLGTSIIVSTAGCSSDSSTAKSSADPAYVTVSPGTHPSGEPLPEPKGPVVLTVSGAVDSGPVTFDMESLESLGLVEYAAYDKQAEGRTATFRGVLLSTLLNAVGADAATTLHTIALNDYAVDIPAQDAADFPVLLATSVDGERMSVERYGPVRVIYPTKGMKLDPAVYDPRWIWQISTIEVS